MTASNTKSPAIRQPLEIGIVIAGRFNLRQRQLLSEIQAQFVRNLEHWFPDFDWRITISRRRDIGEYRREESTYLLRQAAEERDTYHWDFAILLTHDELLAHYRSFALAALSRPLDAAVVSTARLIPDEDGPGLEDATLSNSIIVNRVAIILMHAISHLGGLKANENKQSLLYKPGTTQELDAMISFTPDELNDLSEAFADIADTRLEETHTSKRSTRQFFARAAWINREEIVEAIIAARPWQFPRHLSRLTTAAVSTVVLLLMSAESWDLGLSQNGLTNLGFGIFVLALTTIFVTFRQHLLLSRDGYLREQIVVTCISAVGIVVLGLAITWLLMFLLAVLVTSVLFPVDLISSWTASSQPAPERINFGMYLRMSAFCASVGLLIGSLGASFEEQSHFQHVIFVDEEL